MRPGPLPIVVLAAVAAIAVSPRFARGYDTYNNGCTTCHGAFNTVPYASPTGETYPSSNHDLHQFATWMAADCALCHTTGDNYDPLMGSSDGTATTTGYGCAGCHGQIDGTEARGYGLRAHHDLGGVTT